MQPRLKNLVSSVALKSEAGHMSVKTSNFCLPGPPYEAFMGHIKKTGLEFQETLCFTSIPIYPDGYDS